MHALVPLRQGRQPWPGKQILRAEHLSCAWSGSRSPSSAMYQALCRMLSGAMLALIPSLVRAARASSLSKGAAGKAVSVSSRAASSGTLHGSVV